MSRDIHITGSASWDVKEKLMKALNEAGFATLSDVGFHELKQVDDNHKIFTLCVDNADGGACTQQDLLPHQYRYLWGEQSNTGECIESLQEFLRVNEGEQVEGIRDTAKKDLSGAVQSPQIRFTSTRGRSDNVTFLSVVCEGLAKDGGLYIPTHIPTMLASKLDYLCCTRGLCYTEAAQIILEHIIDTSISPAALHPLIVQAYKPSRWSGKEDVCPVTPLLLGEACGGVIPSDTPTLLWHQDISVMELYHGPTASFKDFALQLFPLYFNMAADEKWEHALSTKSREAEGAELGKVDEGVYLILTATSGDTGVAAISGFTNAAGRTKVMVLYPLYGTSPVQKLQMLSYDDGTRVRVFGIDTDFDFCQKAVKTVFMDSAMTERLAARQPPLKLSSANSINWGRLVPQVVYYFWAYRQHVQRSKELIASCMDWKYGDPIDFVVPCGNFGNILSGYIAKLMGLPIRKLIVASNKNDVLYEFIQTGCYDIRKRRMESTASPSIDILKASNVERFLYLISDGDTTLVKAAMEQLDSQGFFHIRDDMRLRMSESFCSGRCDEEACAAMIKEVYESSKGRRLLDPHTAVAMHVAKAYRQKLLHDGDLDPCQSVPPLVVLSTAHWAKFPEAVLHALRGEAMTLTPSMSNPIDAVRHVQGLYEQILQQVLPNATERALDAANNAVTIHPVLAGILQKVEIQASGPRTLGLDVEAVKAEVEQFGAA